MFLTITANSALDRVMFIERFIPGTVMRPLKTVVSVGGKGFDVSVVLRALGLETLGLGFMAGENGRQLVRLLESYGIQHDLVWVEGDTRISHVIVETALQRDSHINTRGYAVPVQAYVDFLERLSARTAQAQWVIASGSLPEGVPPDLYRVVTEIAAAQQVPVTIDASGQPALAALAARPTLFKMNDAEFGETFGISPASPEALARQARAVFEQHRPGSIIITCGNRGILAITPSGSYLARAPAQIVVNTAGAGDAVSAALAWQLSTGADWPTALQWAAAAGAAVVLTEGTADCRRSDIERIFPDVIVQNIPGVL